MKRNFQKELDSCIEKLKLGGKVPSLLLHGCCAPCSSYVLEYLSEYFDITVFFFNPNIDTQEEYGHRARELTRLLGCMNLKRPASLIACEYEDGIFFEAVRGLENEPEGGLRCWKCYELRLRAAAKEAKKRGFDYFATTLTLSPHKDAAALNEIGERIAEELGVKYMVSDFKKKNGYIRSIELSKEYGLYRQNYCGCVFSINRISE